jgi:predicted dehydrogenase
MTQRDPPFPTTPLRLGFVGGGINSAIGRAHFNATAIDGLYRLEAGCFSRHAEINAASAVAYGVAAERTYADWQTMLATERGRLDAVAILTPTSDHVAPVIAFLDAGYAVICEKALAADIDGVKAIRAAEARSGSYLAVTFNYTGYPALREIRAMLSGGRLGKLLHFDAEMPQEGFIRRHADGLPVRPQDWRLRDGTIPTVYLDLGVHLHQIVHYLCALRPQSVSAFHGSFGNFPEVIDYVSASACYENGVHGRFHFGKSLLGHRNGLRIRLYGSHASIEWEQTNPEQIRVSHASGRIELLDRGAATEVAGLPRYTRFKAGHPAGYIEAFANIYLDVHDEIPARPAGGEGDREVFGSEVALAGLIFLSAMAESAGANAARLPVRTDTTA